MDAVDPHAVGEFWARALGLTAEFVDAGDIRLFGPDLSQTVWINRVPEAKTVKHRVHLDVFAPSLDEFADAPRLTESGQYPWTVVADPERGEMCVFVSDTVPRYRLKDLVVDACEPATIAQWWGEVIGGTVVVDGDYSYLDDVPGVPFDDIDFVPVPEGKTVKNRIHWDVRLLAGVTVGDVLAKGATLLRAADDDIDWNVMADPEGNEFCVFAAA